MWGEAIRWFLFTQAGCMGDKSVPVTSAFGYLSAKSLSFGGDQWFSQFFPVCQASILHGPDTGACPNIDDSFGLIAYRRHEQLMI